MAKDSPESKRKHPRVIKPIRVEHLSGDTYLYDYSHDVSESGIFILTDNLLEPGAVIDLKLSVPGQSEKLEMKGEVVWVNRQDKLKPIDSEQDMALAFEKLLQDSKPAQTEIKPVGMGIRFIDITDDQRTQLKKLLT